MRGKKQEMENTQENLNPQEQQQVQQVQQMIKA
jgi:hypothetical protein